MSYGWFTCCVSAVRSSIDICVEEFKFANHCTKCVILSVEVIVVLYVNNVFVFNLSKIS